MKRENREEELDYVDVKGKHKIKIICKNKCRINRYFFLWGPLSVT